MKEWKRRLSGVMVPAVIAASWAAMPVLAQETGVSVQEEQAAVTLAENKVEISTEENFGQRLQELQTQNDVTGVILKEGTYTLSADNLARITKTGFTIEGAGEDKTIIDCGGKLVSGNAGVLVEASNVSIKDVTIKTTTAFTGNKALIKAGKIAASAETDPERIQNFALENVSLICDKKSAGIDINSVDGFSIKNVTIKDSAKVGISITSGTGGKIEKVSTSGSAWGSVGIMEIPAITQTRPASSVELGAGNQFGENSLYIERTGTGEEQKDCGQITGEVPDGFASTSAGGKTVFAPLTSMIGQESFDQNFVLYGTAKLAKTIEVASALTIAGAEDGAAVEYADGTAFSVKEAGVLNLKDVDVTAKDTCIENAGQTTIAGGQLQADGVILKNTAEAEKMKASNVTLVPKTYEEGKVLAENMGELTGDVKDTQDQIWNIEIKDGNVTLTEDTTVDFVSEASAYLADSQGNPAEIKVSVPNLSEIYENDPEDEGKNVTYSVVLAQADAAENPPADQENALMQAFDLHIEKKVGTAETEILTPEKELEVQLTVSENFVTDGLKLFYDDGAGAAPAEVTVTAAERTLRFKTQKFGKFILAGETLPAFDEEIVLEGTYQGKADGVEGDYAVIGKKLTASLKLPESEATTETEPTVTPEPETESETVSVVTTVEETQEAQETTVEVEYQWYRSTDAGFEPIEGANQASYQPVEADENKVLKVQAVKAGAMKYSQGITVVEGLDSKYTQAPDAPRADTVTTTSVTLRTVKSDYDDAVVEYGIERADGQIEWQRSTRFTSLKSNTQYYFYTRYAAEGVYKASKASGASSVWTDRVSTAGPIYGNNNNNNGFWGGVFVPGSSSEDGDPINFHDMQGYDWAAAAVDALSAAGVIKGTSAYTFSPADSIKRGDFVLMLDRMLGFNTSSNYLFEDVPEDSYYASAIGRARYLGIINGYDYNHFGPEDPISRQDIITMAYRAFLKMGIISTSYNQAALEKYEDRSQIADYALEAMMTMTDKGIIIGNEQNRVNPEATATRAEIAVMCYRLRDLI
ncbi:S-layer homology domain-containing protein [Ructibacterium gallinarum]|uniref:S-layer homology domain-containing protein n=1 Tax=Ructibacterium gallinarum TaxID=2779355 RepID=A0A9D5M5Q6_9FIRM|nr:S-layer homology domain-containing protein [Ructibacterium gallinarum]MBE5040054.1 S-layer homology domain-containing protein [Ructibacterium gallinarum]